MRQPDCLSVFIQEEETYRRKIWEDNVRYIEQHNLEYSMGKHTFTVGMNPLGDLVADNSTEEFEGDEFDEDEESDGDDELDKESDGADDELDEESDDDVTPVNVDWRKRGVVTPVKNQMPNEK
ncbi:hypothetical protein scyTo_0008750 [Scyliorhinus torazame]|uniref:Cathepsin propeptide inhibitor domain-containing protein n=1 Tax=Scyliorhinus torazame TaxID=75743 RepID=A0A401PD45_SCYTO|nr:hypothetical protein [Scyliorhinus torazame]